MGDVNIEHHSDSKALSTVTMVDNINIKRFRMAEHPPSHSHHTRRIQPSSYLSRLSNQTALACIRQDGAKPRS
jgi:hypothetical protein